MALADARAMYPRLRWPMPIRRADLRLLEAVADWCDRYTPLIGLDPPDGLILDISGCAHLFGGEAALARDLLQRLDAQGFAGARRHRRYGRLRLGGGEVSASPPASSRPASCARCSNPCRSRRCGISPEIAARSAQVGLKRIGDVLDRPRAPLAARFGTDLRAPSRSGAWGGRRVDHAAPAGAELPSPSSASPNRSRSKGRARHHRASCRAELARAMERHGEGARLVEAALFRADGKVLRISSRHQPRRCAMPGAIRRLFAERLAASATSSIRASASI